LYHVVDSFGVIAYSDHERDGIEERFLKHIMLEELGWEYFALKGYTVRKICKPTPRHFDYDPEID
jgi:hypothetical protein